MQVTAARRFLLLPALLAKRIRAEHQTGNGEKNIEQINIRHAHHLPPLLYAAAEETTRRPYLPTVFIITY